MRPADVERRHGAADAHVADRGLRRRELAHEVGRVAPPQLRQRHRTTVVDERHARLVARGAGEMDGVRLAELLVVREHEREPGGAAGLVERHLRADVAPGRRGRGRRARHALHRRAVQPEQIPDRVAQPGHCRRRGARPEQRRDERQHERPARPSRRAPAPVLAGLDARAHRRCEVRGRRRVLDVLRELGQALRHRRPPPRAAAAAPATGATSRCPGGTFSAAAVSASDSSSRCRQAITSRSRSGNRSIAASSASRSLAARSAASGDGAASARRRSSPARSSSAVRRPAARRWLRASLATMRSSHGRNGAPERKRCSAR